MTPDANTAAASAVAPHSMLMALLSILFLDLGFLTVLIIVAQTLRHTKGWSLAGALSEDIHRPNTPDAALSTIPPKLGAAGIGQITSTASTPLDVQYDASSSRLIAFVGMLAILMLFVAMGNWMIWQSFTSGKVPDGTTRMLAFLGGGASLFVPYAVNQFRAAFEAFGGNGTTNHN